MKCDSESFLLTKLKTILHRTANSTHITRLLMDTLEKYFDSLGKTFLKIETFLVTLSSIRCFTLFLTFLWIQSLFVEEFQMKLFPTWWVFPSPPAGCCCYLLPSSFERIKNSFSEKLTFHKSSPKLFVDKMKTKI